MPAWSTTRLAAIGRVVDGDREDDSLDVRGDGGEVHLDGLVVTLALAGEVVAGVLDRRGAVLASFVTGLDPAGERLLRDLLGDAGAAEED